MEEQKTPAEQPKVETAEPEAVAPAEEVTGEEIGTVDNYLDKIGVAIINFTGTLNKGDKIRVKGPQTDFEQTADSMQIEHDVVETANAGQSVGLKVSSPVRKKDKVYKL